MLPRPAGVVAQAQQGRLSLPLPPPPPQWFHQHAAQQQAPAAIDVRPRIPPTLPHPAIAASSVASSPLCVPTPPLYNSTAAASLRPAFRPPCPPPPRVWLRLQHESADGRVSEVGAGTLDPAQPLASCAALLRAHGYDTASGAPAQPGTAAPADSSDRGLPRGCAGGRSEGHGDLPPPLLGQARADRGEAAIDEATDGPGAAASSPTEIYIGNVAPIVSEAALRELLTQAGPTQLRMPRERDGSGAVTAAHRGFGFAEFGDRRVAEYAVALLSGVALAGQPLRLRLA